MSNGTEDVFKIDEKKLEENLRQVQARLFAKGFYREVDTRWADRDSQPSDSQPIEYHPTITDIATIVSLDSVLATYLTLQEQLTNYYLSKSKDKSLAIQLSPAERKFINLFSLYAACVEGIEILKPYVSDPEKATDCYRKITLKHFTNKTSGYDLDLSRSGGESLEGVIESYCNIYIRNLGKKFDPSTNKKFIQADLDFANFTIRYYQALVEYLLQEKDNPVFNEMRDMFNFPLQINRISIAGFSHSGNAFEADAEDFHSETTYKDVIGNDEAKLTLPAVLEKLFFYDPENKKNLWLEIGDLPRTILLYAGPGTGKTMLLQATINFGYELETLTGKNFVPVEINQLIKDKYVGEGEKNLEKKLQQGMKEDRIGLLIIEDIDSLLINRSSDSDTTRAETNLLQHLMNRLEGIGTKYFGNWLIICTSNRPQAIDQALLGRIGQEQIYCPGPQSVEQFMELISGKLRKGVDTGYVDVKEKDLRAAAKICMEREYNGREVASAARRIMTDAAKFRVPKELYSMKDSSKIREMLIDKCNPQRGEDLIQALKDAHEDELNKVEYERQEKVRVIVERGIIQHLAEKELYKKIAEIEGREIVKEGRVDGLALLVKTTLEQMELDNAKRFAAQIHNVVDRFEAIAEKAEASNHRKKSK